MIYLVYLEDNTLQRQILLLQDTDKITNAGALSFIIRRRILKNFCNLQNDAPILQLFAAYSIIYFGLQHETYTHTHTHTST